MDFQGQFDEFANETRLKTLRTICLLGSGAAFLNFLVRLFYFKEVNLNLSTILVSAVFLMGLGAWASSTQKTYFVASAVNIFLFLFVPLRVYQTGGIYSPVLYLYIFHCAFLVSLYGRRAGIKMLYWAASSILAFGVGGAYDLIPETPFYENAILNGIGHIMVLLLTAAFIIQLGKENSKVHTYLKEMEKKHNIYAMMRAYTIETTAPISHALETLKREERGHDREAIFEIEASLREIDKAVKRLGKEARQGPEISKITTGGGP